MILQLRQLFDIEGQALDIDESISVSELGENVPYHTFAAPVSVKGAIKNRAGIVTLKFTVTALLEHECDRCLEAFERAYSFDFSHTLARTLSNGDDDEFDDYVVCPDNTLDLSELALSDLMLSLPSKILCKEDCLGLCMKCGKNLNDGECCCDNED